MLKPLYVDRPHLKELIISGRAWTTPVELSQTFQQFMIGLPWGSSSLEWQQLPTSWCLDISASDEAAVERWLQRTKLAQVPYLALVFSCEQPGLAMRTADAVRSLDMLCWATPGPHFLCGLGKDDEGWVPRFEAFAQFDGSAVVRAPSRLSVV
jgi:hypothetical protein